MHLGRQQGPLWEAVPSPVVRQRERAERVAAEAAEHEPHDVLAAEAEDETPDGATRKI